MAKTIAEELRDQHDMLYRLFYDGMPPEPTERVLGELRILISRLEGNAELAEVEKHHREEEEAERAAAYQFESARQISAARRNHRNADWHQAAADTIARAQGRLSSEETT